MKIVGEMKLEASLNYFKKRRNKVQLMEEECAIYALEKQIPKKAKIVNRIRGGFRNYTCKRCGEMSQIDQRVEIKEIYCKSCGKVVDGTFTNYCGNCGQALDWGEVEK